MVAVDNAAGALPFNMPPQVTLSLFHAD